MHRLIIQGGTPLSGEVTLSGAKNAALPVLPTVLLTDKPCVIAGVPSLEDVKTLVSVLESLGTTQINSPWALSLQTPSIKTFEPNPKLVQKMRASILVLGPLLARYGQANVALPGGCAIGDRPIDQHLRGLEQLGAHISVEQDRVIAKASRLKGAQIHLSVPTVTGTENLLMAATLAKGTTVLKNAAREPEIVELATVLSKMGAIIEGAGTSEILIEGKEILSGFTHELMPDRIEAGTFLAAAMVTYGDITIHRFRAEDLEVPLMILKKCGAQLEFLGQSLRIKAPNYIAPMEVETKPFPGFPTDLQSQFMVIATIAQGISSFQENIFENRYMHVSELAKMGAQIQIEGNRALIHGTSKLQGTDVFGSDLRASASLVLAGLAAKGQTIVHNLHHLDRGYEGFEKKLSKMGANISRVDQSPSI